MVICLERGADLHTAQLMPLPLTVTCFSKIQYRLTQVVPDKGPINGCVCVCVCVCVWLISHLEIYVRFLEQSPEQRTFTDCIFCFSRLNDAACMFSSKSVLLTHRINSSYISFLGGDNWCKSWLLCVTFRSAVTIAFIFHAMNKDFFAFTDY